MKVHPQNQSAETIVQSELARGVLRLTMNWPERRNALSEAMLDALQAAFDRAKDSNEVRVVILAGNGPVFSSGHDLREMSARRSDKDRGRAYFEWLLAKCSALMQSIVHCPKPVVAEIAGIATAAGCQLASSCDLIVASSNAKFATPGVNLGLFCSTPMVAVSRVISRRHTMEMLLTGDMMDAATAFRFGLVNRVTAPDELEQTTQALAEQIASKSTAAVAIGKEAFYRQRELTLEDAYAYCSDVMVQNMLFRDAEEGIGAFFQKREPVWEDR